MLDRLLGIVVVINIAQLDGVQVGIGQSVLIRLRLLIRQVHTGGHWIFRVEYIRLQIQPLSRLPSGVQPAVARQIAVDLLQILLPADLLVH